MTDPAPAPDQVITDEQLRAELERDPNLLHRLRADEERAYVALSKTHVHADHYLKRVKSAIDTGRAEILQPKKGGKVTGETGSDLAEARHILSAIATYKAIEEGAPGLHKRPADAPAIEVNKR
jgi:hypothetical protein